MDSNYRPRVLLVEDELDLVFLLERTLRDHGFDTSTCVDGNIALARALAQPPDMLVLDWMLPGVDGIELCRRLKADPRSAHVPVLLITARGRDADVFRALAEGADDCMIKPFGLAEFVQRVRALAGPLRPVSAR
ncbi:MAG: response regulator [Planctomycetes bacterium]|nr:response regulator [Planctomycetota bacterium]